MRRLCLLVTTLLVMSCDKQEPSTAAPAEDAPITRAPESELDEDIDEDESEDEDDWEEEEVERVMACCALCTYGGCLECKELEDGGTCNTTTIECDRVDGRLECVGEHKEYVGCCDTCEPGFGCEACEAIETSQTCSKKLALCIQDGDTVECLGRSTGCCEKCEDWGCEECELVKGGACKRVPALCEGEGEDLSCGQRP